MKKFLTVLIVLLSLASPYLLPSRAGASPYYWSSYSEKDGLIYNTIAALAIDPGGYVWIGTGDAAAAEKGGLSVFDRMGQFVSYTTAQGLGSNDIRAIAFEKVPEAQIDAADQGAIWIATRKGVSVLTRRGEWLPALPGSNALPGEDISALFIDRANTKWIAVRGSGVCSIDSAAAWVNYSAAQGLCSNTILCITQDSSGSIWFGSQDNGACYRDPKSGAWVTFSSENSGLIGNCVRQVVEEKPGTLWFVTASGVSVFSGQNWMSYTAKNSPLAGFAPACMVIDRDGNKWIGTENGGLFRLDSRGGWTRFTEKNSGLTDNRVTALALDQEETLWIGTASGLFRASAAAELLPVSAAGKKQQRKPLGLGAGRYVPFQDAMVWAAREQPASPVSLSFYLPALYAPGKLWFYSALWADGNFKIQNSSYQVTETRQGALSATVQGMFSRAQVLIAGAMLLSDPGTAFDKSRGYPFPPQQPDDRAVYLQPGAHIPCDDPAIKALADAIVPPASRTDMYRAARAIVYSHPVQDCALDSARDAAAGADTLLVLKEKKGGRREKARLLCALARAAGIPARIASGSGGVVWAQLFMEGGGWIPVEVSYPAYDYMRPYRTGMPGTISSEAAPALAIAGIDDDVQRLSWEPQVPASAGNAGPGELPPVAGASLLLLKINREDRVPDDAKVNIAKDIFVLAGEELGETVLLFHDRTGRTIKRVPLPANNTASTVSIAGRLQWRFIPRRISQILAIENLECKTDEEAKR